MRRLEVLTDEACGTRLNERTEEDPSRRQLTENFMSIQHGGKRPLWTCLTVLAVFALAFCAATPAARADGGKMKHPNPNAQQLTADKTDAMIVQLANDVFKRAVRAHNSALNRNEFHKATELVRGEILTWASNGM